MSGKIRIAFSTHGLGDVVHCCTAMRLYIARGYDVQIQVEPNKRWLFEAAGIPIYSGFGPNKLPIHPYHYPDMQKFFDIGTEDHLYSKIAHLFEIRELPKLGTKEEVWQAMCAERIDASPAVSETARMDVAKFLEGLPKPIVLLHSKGTNWQEEKSIPDLTAFELLKLLVNSFQGSVIVLDWDARTPSLCHPRARGISPYFTHMSTEHFGALCEMSDLLIGVDSGPFHLAGWFDIQTLFVARKIPPVRCCLPSPRATYLVSSAQHEHWAARGPEWRFVEFSGPEATAKDIVFTANKILKDSEFPMTKPSPLSQIIPELIPGKYIYKRIGHDERPMELLEGGKIGTGAAGCERVWAIESTPVGHVVTIYGQHGGPTCHLQMDPDGVLRGRWLAHERMPIELVREAGYVAPTPEVVTWNDLETDKATEPVCPVHRAAEPKTLGTNIRPFVVGIPTLNRYDLLEKCIAACWRSTVIPQRLIVIDNGGSLVCENAHVVRPMKNLGVAASWNMLHRVSQPLDLIILNDDIEPGRNLFERILEQPESFVTADESHMFGAFLIRREVWTSVGEFDETFYPAYHEDNDYFMRLRLAKIAIGCPRSDGYKENGPSATKARFTQEQLNEFNAQFDYGRKYYVRKWGGPPHLETFALPFNGTHPVA